MATVLLGTDVRGEMVASVGGTDNKQRGDGGHNVVRDRHQTEGRWWPQCCKGQTTNRGGMVATVLLGTDNKQRGDGGLNVVRDRQQTEGGWWPQCC